MGRFREVRWGRGVVGFGVLGFVFVLYLVVCGCFGVWVKHTMVSRLHAPVELSNKKNKVGPTASWLPFIPPRLLKLEILSTLVYFCT